MESMFVPGKMVEVPEIPYTENVVLKPSETALLIVDMQNDFVKPGGSLVVPSANDTIPHIWKILNYARENKVHIAFMQDTHFEGDKEWNIWPEHCKNESWGWKIIEELTPGENELVCVKNRYDAFYETWLDHFLSRTWKVKNLIITGTVSNICVLHTAASAGMRWMHVIMATRANTGLR